MHQPPIPHVASTDPDIAGLIEGEARRQFEKVRLIPSENYASVAVLEATGSVLTNKYSEGYPGQRYYEGQQVIDQIETLARTGPRRCSAWITPMSSRTRARRPTSPSTWRSSSPGTPSWGWRFRWAGISPTAGRIGDRQMVPRGAVRGPGRHRPRRPGRGSRPGPRRTAEDDFLRWHRDPADHRLPGFAEIAGEIGAILVADIAHIAGLIAGGAHPSPVGTPQ